jgi:hypothetical protein
MSLLQRPSEKKIKYGVQSNIVIWFSIKYSPYAQDSKLVIVMFVFMIKTYRVIM